MILQYPHPLLITPTKDYNIMTLSEEEINRDFKFLVNMIKHTENGIALAANQAGLSNSMFVYQDALKSAEFGMHISTFTAILNPKIVSVTAPAQQVLYPEGCLSFNDGQTAHEGLFRYPEITVNYWTYPGMVEVRNHFITGFEAQMFQHEIDHLLGKTIMDRLVKS